MLCVWLPLLRVVLGNVPNAHLLGSLWPGGRASWLSSAPPAPAPSLGTMGSFETGQMERLRAAWSRSPGAPSLFYPSSEGEWVWGDSARGCRVESLPGWAQRWSCGLRPLTQKFQVPPKKIQCKWTCDEVMKFYSSVENKKRARHREGDLDHP